MYTNGSHLALSRVESPCFVLSRGPNADQTAEGSTGQHHATHPDMAGPGLRDVSEVGVGAPRSFQWSWVGRCRVYDQVDPGLMPWLNPRTGRTMVAAERASVALRDICFMRHTSLRVTPRNQADARDSGFLLLATSG